MYFEDFALGQRIEMGPREVSLEEIVKFARRFDPQPFHLDEEAGRASLFGGLVASGWHTAAICMRMMVDGYLNRAASMGSPGVDELRWIRPVRPGDRLRLTMTVTEILPSRSKPDRGVVKSLHELHNQNGELVMTLKGLGMYARRPAAIA
ncbi:MAG: MaoC family dehydratase [Alphaproteobacteria bacterium]|nr:MaoC family dehydratase [Alphaproteobacteria bacterium]